MELGRIEITTNVRVINRDNVVSVLQQAIGKHRINAARIQFLLDYESGIQPLTRQKLTRKDIDVAVVDNVASEVTTFWLGYQWGNPPVFVQRVEDNNNQPEKAQAVKLLNDFMDATGHKTDSQKNGRFIEICGIGYTYIDINTDYEDGDSYFTRDVLDPRTTFVVRSSYYPDRRPMLGVTFGIDDDGVTRYSCFTNRERFEIKSFQIVDEEERAWVHDRERQSGAINPIGRIPIIEWFRSYDRMGVFEKQIPECDNLNILVSEFTDDVIQNTNAIWWTNDVDFAVDIVENEDGTETETIQKPRDGEWLRTYTPKDGKTPMINPLAIPYDYSGMLNNITTRRELILQKCNVPMRNSTSGGSTGVAMDSASGWAMTETVSNQETMILDGCRMEELKVILSAIRNSQNVPSDSPLLGLRYSDVQITTRRAKQYELSSSINFIATGLAHGIAALPLFKAAGIFADPNAVWAESRETIERYQSSIFDKQSTEPSESDAQDLSDQISNSPFIDGMNTDTDKGE